MLLLLLLQVLASCLWLGCSKVVTPFQSCPQFFFRGTPPNNALVPENPAWICQHYDNHCHFATLYNRDLRIPVYSAYIYQPGNATKPGNIWMVEPQLIDLNYPSDMEKESTLMHDLNITSEQIKNSQASHEDYKNLTGMDHGHLNPSCHQPTFKSKKATFTLTNIVPQNKDLNDGAWSQYEVQMMINKTKDCTTTYVVVGAVPGNNFIAKGRVNKPSYIWSGVCCEMGNNQRKTWAVIAENDKNEVKNITLGQLEKRLTELYGKGQVSLFHPDCPRQ